ncbi:MAG: tRNA pseudouridine(38-40) synthase TruA [Bacteroidales bacterium]|nr:tRNA pseudouridine(38-40) synthase TruA [Bacteroidales bacterium]
MSRFFIRLSYDGTGFHGWQRQPNGITVQQTLEDAMSMMLRCQVPLTGAGRTDTGVHANEFYAHFEFNQPLTNTECEHLVFRLNEYLGGDISLFCIFPVKADAHARFSALSRTYRYSIARVRNPFRRKYTHYIYGNIDQAIMNVGAGLIMGVHDFTSFSKVDTDTMTNICNVTHASWEMEGTELVFTITADRFLRNMVRAIVGTLLQLGLEKISLEQLEKIIESKDRSRAGDSAPAKGLALHRIVYPEEIFLEEGNHGTADC